MILGTSPIRAYEGDELIRRELEKVNTTEQSEASLAHHDNRIAIVDIDGWCTVYDGESEEQLARFRCHWSSGSPCWSPDDKYLATCGLDGFVKVWDTQTWEWVHTFGGHRGKVNRTAWSPDGQQLASCGADSQIIVWDLQPTSKNVIAAKSEKSDATFFWFGNDHVRHLSDQAILETDVNNHSSRVVQSLDPNSGFWSLITPDHAIARLDKRFTNSTDENLTPLIEGRTVWRLAANQSSESRKLAINDGYRYSAKINPSTQAGWRHPGGGGHADDGQTICLGALGTLHRRSRR